MEFSPTTGPTSAVDYHFQLSRWYAKHALPSRAIEHLQLGFRHAQALDAKAMGKVWLAMAASFALLGFHEDAVDFAKKAETQDEGLAEKVNQLIDLETKMISSCEVRARSASSRPSASREHNQTSIRRPRSRSMHYFTSRPESEPTKKREQPEWSPKNLSEFVIAEIKNDFKTRSRICTQDHLSFLELFGNVKAVKRSQRKVQNPNTTLRELIATVRKKNFVN